MHVFAQDPHATEYQVQVDYYHSSIPGKYSSYTITGNSTMLAHLLSVDEYITKQRDSVLNYANGNGDL